MATETVMDPSYATLNLSDINRLNRLGFQAKGIANLIAAASDCETLCDGDAIPAGCWVIQNLIEEIAGIVQGAHSRHLPLAVRQP